MKKSLALFLFLSNLLPILSVGAWYVDPNRAFYPDAPYDYIRLGYDTPFPDYTVITLEDGDIAWSLNDSACDVILENDFLITYENARCIVGPCVFRPTQIQKYKIDRASRRQNKYNPGTLKPGTSLQLLEGDLLTIVGKSKSEGNAYTIRFTNEVGIIEEETPWTDSFDEYEFGLCEIINTTSETEIYYILRKREDTGSRTMIFNESEYNWEYSDGSQHANNGSSGAIDPTSIKYDELFGWAYFTDTNWIYSYTNLSWYYLHPTNEGFYVWNANLPDNGWMLLERG